MTFTSRRTSFATYTPSRDAHAVPSPAGGRRLLEVGDWHFRFEVLVENRWLSVDLMG